MNNKKQLFTLFLLVLFLFSACAPQEDVVVVMGAPADGALSLDPLPLEIDANQAAEWREQGYFMLDVREPDEWAAGHIPGATLIPLGELGERFGELPTDQPIIVYCRSGNRSAVARDFLLGMFPAVTSMGGGFNAWVSAGYEIETGQ